MGNDETVKVDLGSGEVDLPIRVDPALTDPRSEVGQVGHALNHMLNNVEGALESRQQSEVKVRQFVADASHELRNPLASSFDRSSPSRTIRCLPATCSPICRAAVST